MSKDRDDERNTGMPGEETFSLEEILAEFGGGAAKPRWKEDTIPFPVTPRSQRTAPSPAGPPGPGKVVSFPAGRREAPPPAPPPQPEPEEPPEDGDKVLEFPGEEGPASDTPIAGGLNRLFQKADDYAGHMFEEEGKEDDEEVRRAEEYIPGTDEEEPEEPSRFELWLDRHLGSEKAASFFITVAVVLGIVFSVGLFILLPTALTGLVGLAVPLPMWLRNLLEGVVRIVIFMGYLMLCSHMKDIRRVFQYHGAEHKTIFCYEHGLPLTVENVRIQPRHHPRCGTSFLFVVIVVSILLSSVLFSFVEVTNTFARMGLHLLLLPVIVSLTYELNRVVGRYDNRLTRLVSAPGMWLQNWTTFEPDDSMIEVGIRAFTLVLPEEKGKDQW